MKLRQRKGNLWLGRLKVTFQRLGAYMSYVNFAMLILTFYTVTGYKYASLEVFLVFGVACIIGLAMFDYFIMLPSEVAFQNEQIAKHQNPIYEEIKTLRSKVEELEKDIKL